MSIATANHPGPLIWRVGLWFASLPVAVGLFAGLFCALYSGSPNSWAQPLSMVFRVTMIFAFPVACLYLPVVIALKDAAKQRLWILLVSGVLIGPVCMALWSLILILKGENAHEVWYGDPLVGSGTLAAMTYAFVVGTLATVLYILLLRIRARLTAVSYPSAT